MLEVQTIIIEQHQVFGLIVLTISIHVMDNFLWIQKPAQLFFHHQAVQSDVAMPVSIGVIFRFHQHITVLVNQATTAPVLVLLAVASAWPLTGDSIASQKVPHCFRIVINLASNLPAI